TVDAVLLVYDAPVPSPIDIDLRQWLRKEYPNIPVVEVVNKIDNPDDAADILPNFFEVGLSPQPVSAKSRLNLRSLCQELNKKLKNRAISRSKSEPKTKQKVDQIEETQKDDSTIVSDESAEDLRIAIVGKPNVGKSSLFNRWIGRNLSIVSDIPGTTRDTVDTVFRHFGRDIRVIDTAGLRRQTKIKDRPEFFSSRRTRRAIQDSHVVVQLLNAVDGVTDYDKKIASLVQELSRPSIIIINKWDAITEKETNTQKEFLENVQSLFPHLKKIPIFFTSALTGKRAMEPLQKAIEVFDRSTFRVPTAKLNDLIKKWVTGKQGIPKGFKLLYCTQTSRMPPVFVLFVNRTDLLPRNAIRYLENQIRDEFKLEGIPIRILIREKSEQNEKSDRPSKVKASKKSITKSRPVKR
ncbi:MAG: ribosome biogenesis GTPase Der, partial [Leptonema sp. (in: Bacteria)]|nr:ribosome biogenesis GTPase Der [Leptonema sp. (in: bacteria)]